MNALIKRSEWLQVLFIFIRFRYIFFKNFFGYDLGILFGDRDARWLAAIVFWTLNGRSVETTPALAFFEINRRKLFGAASYTYTARRY
jgi:hypothetical protein